MHVLLVYNLHHSPSLSNATEVTFNYGNPSSVVVDSDGDEQFKFKSVLNNNVLVDSSRDRFTSPNIILLSMDCDSSPITCTSNMHHHSMPLSSYTDSLCIVIDVVDDEQFKSMLNDELMMV